MNYPAAKVVILDDGGLDVELGSLVVAVRFTRDAVVLTQTTESRSAEIQCFENPRDASDRVLGILGAAWRAEQRPRTSPGGLSSYGGDDCDAVSGDYYEPSDDDGDGGDE